MIAIIIILEIIFWMGSILFITGVILTIKYDEPAFCCIGMLGTICEMLSICFYTDFNRLPFIIELLITWLKG